MIYYRLLLTAAELNFPASAAQGTDVPALRCCRCFAPAGCCKRPMRRRRRRRAQAEGPVSGPRRSRARAAGVPHGRATPASPEVGVRLCASPWAAPAASLGPSRTPETLSVPPLAPGHASESSHGDLRGERGERRRRWGGRTPRGSGRSVRYPSRVPAGSTAPGTAHGQSLQPRPGLGARRQGAT
jgi:hypothetical protein